MKNRLSSTLATGILIAVVIFLAADVGFYLYNPNRFASTLPVCTLNIISGDTKVQTRGRLNWEKAEDGMILEPGSRVRTAPDAHASLTFSRGTTTKLEPGTDLIVSKLESSQGTRPDTIVLEQRAGKTWNQIAPRPDGYYFQVKTSSADVRVRGTLFSTEVDASGQTLIQTTEGQVSVSAQGQEVLVSAGQQTTVEPGATPAVPAPVPPPKNELALTIDRTAVALIIDPSGSGTGYLPDGSPLNQIPGSRVSRLDESRQTIRIPEPNVGEYSVILRVRGVADGDSPLRIEGLAEGKSVFLFAESGNITSINEVVLKLHLDVIDGILRGATLNESPVSQPVATSVKTTKPEAESVTPPQESSDGSKTPLAAKEGKTPDQESFWFHQEAYKYDQVIVAGSIVVLAVVFAILWRKRQ